MVFFVSERDTICLWQERLNSDRQHFFQNSQDKQPQIIEHKKKWMDILVVSFDRHKAIYI